MNIYLYIYIFNYSFCRPCSRPMTLIRAKGARIYTGEGPSALGTKNLLLSYPTNYQLPCSVFSWWGTAHHACQLDARGLPHVSLTKWGLQKFYQRFHVLRRLTRISSKQRVLSLSTVLAVPIRISAPMMSYDWAHNCFQSPQDRAVVGTNRMKGIRKTPVAFAPYCWPPFAPQVGPTHSSLCEKKSCSMMSCSMTHGHTTVWWWRSNPEVHYIWASSALGPNVQSLLWYC